MERKGNLNGMSIVICTYNGRHRLGDVLSHIAQLKLDDHLDYELIVVDNASEDGTSEFVTNYWAQMNSRIVLRVINETEPGVMYARKRGIREANYEYIVFCDDDNWLNPEYLLISFSLLQEKSNIAAIGGHGIPTFEVQKPEWFDAYEGHYGCSAQGNGEGPIHPRFYLYTAGMAFKRSIFIKLFESGFENKMEGRKGKLLTAGEDTEWTMFLAICGYELWYSPRLTFMHFMPSGRLTIDYLLRIVRGTTAADVQLFPYRSVYKKKYKSYKGIWIVQFLGRVHDYIMKGRFWSQHQSDRIRRDRLKHAVSEMWKMRGRIKSETKRVMEMKAQFHQMN